MNRARVLIADDHAFVLEGLVNLLKDKFEVVAAVTSGSLLVDAATRLRPDVVVTDISMPGLSGIEAFEQLKAAGLEAKVIVLTLYTDAELAAKLIRSGVSGFVMKLLATSELVTAIEQVLLGHAYLSPSLGMDGDTEKRVSRG
jgi:DNA-binding NarL/FixJ family response regulator